MMITKMALCASMLMLADPQADGQQSPQRTAPLIRGAFWIVPCNSAITRERFEQIIQAQCDVGFNRLWIINSPELFAEALRNDAAGKPYDPLDLIFQIADQKHLRVMVALPQGGWYGKAKAEDVIDIVGAYVRDIHARYGKHPSLWGWYLNYEISPVSPDDAEQSAWWRKVWREEVKTCHQTRPGSIVTISPFFLLDDQRRRGFVYLTPSQYAAWWGETLKQTGIDVLMLQDSGEHLGFFTLQQREPFWAAVAEACARAGARFWLNVESGEMDVADWEQAVSLERQNAKIYESLVGFHFTPIEKLIRKLELASRYADEIINWGYFPFMASEDGGKETDQQRAAYRAYQTYYESKTNGSQSNSSVSGPQGSPD